MPKIKHDHGCFGCIGFRLWEMKSSTIQEEALNDGMMTYRQFYTQLHLFSLFLVPHDTYLSPKYPLYTNVSMLLWLEKK